MTRVLTGPSARRAESESNSLPPSRVGATDQMSTAGHESWTATTPGVARSITVGEPLDGRNRNGRAWLRCVLLARQRRRTRTGSSRCTVPSSRSSSRRAAVPIALIMRPPAPIEDPLLGVGLDPDQRADRASGPRAGRSTSSITPRPRAAPPGRCAAAPARAPARRAAPRAAGRRCAARIERSLGHQPTRCSTSARRRRRCAPRPGRRRHRRSSSAAAWSSASAALGSSRSILLTATVTGAERRRALRR